MAVAHRSLASLGFGTRTNSTVAAPSGIVDGDILVYILALANDTAFVSVTPPTGFTACGGSVSGILVDLDPAFTPDTGGEEQLYVWWKRASSESGSYTATHASTETEACVIAYSGAVASADPTDNPNASSNQGINNATLIATGITTAVDGSMVIFIACSWDDMPTNTPPTGTTPTFTERLEAATNLLYVADGVMTTAGATGNKTITGPAAQAWGGALVVIEAPAAGGATAKNLAALGVG
jgi:hypothetical protein